MCDAAELIGRRVTCEHPEPAGGWRRLMAVAAGGRPQERVAVLREAVHQQSFEFLIYTSVSRNASTAAAMAAGSAAAALSSASMSATAAPSTCRQHDSDHHGHAAVDEAVR